MLEKVAPSRRATVFIQLVLCIIQVIETIIDAFLKLLIGNPISILNVIPIEGKEAEVFFRSFNPSL